MADGYWYHSNGKLGGEFHPNKPNDEERYGEYVKVKHGRWIKISDTMLQCSKCCEYVRGTFPLGINYCPHCGAKMDEKE